MPVIPRRLLDAIILGVGKSYHLTMQMTLPPGAAVTLSLSPAFVGLGPRVVWAHYAITISGVTFPTALIGWWHSHRMMVYHWDPFLGSIINQPYYYYVATSTDAPEVIIMSNPTATALTFDVTFWVVEFSTRDTYTEFENVVRGEWMILKALGGQSQADIDSSISRLIDFLKTITPPAPPVPPAPPRREVPKHPTMAEDMGKPIRRLRIP